eukprot:SAG22_NODE_688_length_7907_cov_7.557505_2_plen_235_part_00
MAAPITEEPGSGGLWHCTPAPITDQTAAGPAVGDLRARCEVRVRRLLDALSPLDRLAVRQQYGEPPPTATTSAEAFSLWLAAALQLAPARKLAMLEGTDTLARFAAANELLEKTEARMEAAAGADSARDGGPLDAGWRRAARRVRAVVADLAAGDAPSTEGAEVAARAAFALRQRARPAGGPLAGWLLLGLLFVLAASTLYQPLQPDEQDVSTDTLVEEATVYTGRAARRLQEL